MKNNEGKDNQAPAKSQDNVKRIELSITVPARPPLPSKETLIKHAKNVHVPRRRTTRLATLGCIALIALGGGFLTASFIESGKHTPVTAANQLPKESPKFDTLEPNGKDIKKIGGWTRISPPDRDPVYTFTDKIDHIRINVSEQALPEPMLSDTANKVEELASGFLATEKLSVGSTEVYIGTSSSGAQSVIFTKDRLLVLIKSTGKIDNKKWADYVNSLN